MLNFYTNQEIFKEIADFAATFLDVQQEKYEEPHWTVQQNTESHQYDLRSEIIRHG